MLDGAMGTMIQNLNLSEHDFRGTEFSDWKVSLKGCNDILSLTKPDAVRRIHRQYLSSGADIIETNSFNSNSISMSDYGLSDYVGRLNFEAANLARQEADLWMAEFPDKYCWVAGSIGPTGKSLSMSDEIDNPGVDSFNWNVLTDTYYEQSYSLIKGGVDLLLIETVFDTLNAKAAIFASHRAMSDLNVRIPIIISATLTESGRTLSGQTLEAFISSISHAEPLAVGLNCGFGASGMTRHLATIKHIPYPIIAYPNAGLPNAMGEYDETPVTMSKKIEEMLSSGLVNIVGGCCGSTPEHIYEIAQAATKFSPRVVPNSPNNMELSGLEPLTVSPDRNFLNIGERCNVAGSRKFLRLIKEGNFHEALQVAKSQVEAGAQVIDINMDDAMLDASVELPRFICRIATEPEIAKVPIMIDSSRWDAIEAALKCLQGHSIVNSLSLKEGEDEFIKKAMLVKEYGASLIVMAFDENGQAETFDRKIEVCRRAYRILTEIVGFNGYDIVFDPNILTIATGIEAHERYALDFIDSVRWIKNNLPGAKVSGGVSNLSFAFRGNNYIREAMHAVFLYHAIKAGMDMAIVNANNLVNIDDIESELREVIEDVILCRKSNATERLLSMASQINASHSEIKTSTNHSEDVKSVSSVETIEQLLVRGSTDGLEQALQKALESGIDAIGIINGPLMNGMNLVGKLFGEGKMFLPQIVKSAGAMKTAVDWLTPYMEGNNTEVSSSCKIVLATVKGDVHDIGKNIVGVILKCNGIKVYDMGVMVPGEDIVDKAIEVGADFIGLSGLITPSLEEMCEVARIMERRGLTIPLLVGGATTSALHTAVKIAPCYSGPVFHTHDAASLPPIIQQYMNPSTREDSVRDNFDNQELLRQKYAASPRQLSEKEAYNLRPKLAYLIRKPNNSGIIDLMLPIGKVRDFINWRAFMSAWKLDASLASISGIDGCDHCKAQWLASFKNAEVQKASQAMQLYKEANRLIDSLASGILSKGIRARVAILPAYSTSADSIVVTRDNRNTEIPTPRQKSVRKEGSEVRYALSDFISPADADGNPIDWIGIFTVSVGNELERKIQSLHKNGDEYMSLLYQTVAHRLAEAATEYLHFKVRTEIWGYSKEPVEDIINLSDLKYEGIRPAVGYPSLPDQKLVFTLDKVLDYSSLGIHLTENGALDPSATTTGLMIAHPDSHYFII